jgi:hypothetical protein
VRSDGPFSQLLATQVDELPQQFADQLLLRAEDKCLVLVEGEMLRVWHRPKWITPALWLLSHVNTLFPETGDHVPVTMTIRASNRNGRTIQVWDREFRFPRRRRFVGQLAYDEQLAAVVERFGPGSCLELIWTVRFEAPGTFVIEASQWRFQFASVTLQIPGVLTGSVIASQFVDPEIVNGIRMGLTVKSPLLGEFFGYEGLFAKFRAIGARNDLRHRLL